MVLWLGSFLCGLSFISVIIYGILDKSSEKFFPQRKVDPNENALNFKAVLYFDRRFWLVAIVCMCYYGGIFPFVAIASDFLQTQYNMNSTDAGYCASVVTLASMILSPFLGKFLDVVANRPLFVCIGSLVVIPTHIVLAYKLAHPLVPIIFMGLSFALVPGALWPSIPMIIPSKETATAFGVMAAIQNTGLAAINYVAGIIADKKGYTDVMWFFVAMDCLGLVVAILLLIVDKSKGGTLSKRAQRLEEPVNPDTINS